MRQDTKIEILFHLNIYLCTDIPFDLDKNQNSEKLYFILFFSFVFFGCRIAVFADGTDGHGMSRYLFRSQYFICCTLFSAKKIRKMLIDDVRFQ